MRIELLVVIGTLCEILCGSRDLILKVKFLDQKATSSFVKDFLSKYINKTDDSYEILHFSKKHYLIYIISFKFENKKPDILDIERKFKEIKNEFILDIIIVKNNKIKTYEKLDKDRELQDNLMINKTVTSPFIESDYFFKKNITGKNVSIAIFDSGINNDFAGCNLKEVINFTDENEQDNNGHGTFISSNICRIAINSNIYFFKVFNGKRKTFSSWLYKAIDKALSMNIKIFNFSFGGINFDDYLITSIIKKAVSNGVIIVCAAGNDGPAFGTINYPGNLPYTLTIGALKQKEKKEIKISKISSRGPAIFKKGNGYIDKPDLWSLGENIEGINNKGQILTKSGTSFACSVVTGYLGLLYSSTNYNFTISSLKYLIMKSLLTLKYSNKNELTSKVLDPIALYRYLRKESMINQKFIFLKEIIDFTFSITNEDSHILQKKYYRSEFYSTIQPVFFTIQILGINLNYTEFHISNNFTIESKIEKDKNYVNSPDCIKLELIGIKDKVSIQTHLDVLEFRLGVHDTTDCRFLRDRFDIKVIFSITDNVITQNASFSIILDIVPLPNRFHRLLFDVYHNLYYPFDGVIPKDNLFDNTYSFDWTPDSLFSNYFQLYKALKDEGYYIEELTDPLDCVNLKYYSVLILPDLEKNFTSNELMKLRFEFETNYLSIFIISDWSNSFIQNTIFNIMNTSNLINFGGSNVANMNMFLNHYGIEIGFDSITKDLYIGKNKLIIRSGSSISRFPVNGNLLGDYVNNDDYLLSEFSEKTTRRSLFGLMNKLSNKEDSGRLAILTDSYCIDDFQMKDYQNNCFWLIKSTIRFLMLGVYHSNLTIQTSTKLKYDYYNNVNYSYYKYNQSEKINYTSINQSFKKEVDNEKYQCFYNNYSESYTSYLYYNKSEFSTIQKTSHIPNMYNLMPDLNISKNILDSLEDIIYVVCLILFCFFLFYIYMRRRNEVLQNMRRERVAYTRLTPINETIRNDYSINNF